MCWGHLFTLRYVTASASAYNIDFYSSCISGSGAWDIDDLDSPLVYEQDPSFDISVHIAILKVAYRLPQAEANIKPIHCQKKRKVIINLVWLLELQFDVRSLHSYKLGK